ncbi:MAG TPA: NAD-dependent epimerase/dehydratase family protein [Granulicella sp.]
MKIRAIITGASGMVGEGILLTCLNHPEVEQVLVVGRRTCGHTHPKLREILHKDFFDLTSIEQELAGYNACYFSLGVSSVGMSQEDYRHITYDLTLNFAQTLHRLNPELTFCYVTGRGTDSTEKGRIFWGRVKGATENALLRLFGERAYMFRPAFMKAVPGQKNLLRAYPWFAWIYPLGRRFLPGGFCTLEEVGQAMIHTVTRGFPKKILDVKDIVALAQE